MEAETKAGNPPTLADLNGIRRLIEWKQGEEQLAGAREIEGLPS